MADELQGIADEMQGMEDETQGMKDEIDEMQGMEKRLEKRLSTLEYIMGILEDKARNMARTPTTKHADADADAEGSPASRKYELMEVIKNLTEIRNDLMADEMQGMKDEMRSMLETWKGIMMDEMQGMQKRQGKIFLTLKDIMGILEDKARAEARREFSDDFS
jgi:archaellum component FlaC